MAGFAVGNCGTGVSVAVVAAFAVAFEVGPAEESSAADAARAARAGPWPPPPWAVL